MASTHTMTAFEEDLSNLRSSLFRMGNMAEDMLRSALSALSQGDSALAKKTKAADEALNSLERDVENQVLTLLALRQPMADDLRMALCAIKVSADIERIGDLAKNIARHVGKLGDTSSTQKEVIGEIYDLGTMSLSNLHQALDAFARNDVEAAHSVWQKDAKIDDTYYKVVKTILSAIENNRDAVDDYSRLLFVAKDLERVGDHCSNLAEITKFLVQGGEWAGLVWTQKESPS